LTIQVAALKDGEEAHRIVANLKKAGYPAYLSRRYVPDQGLWFRVRVGAYQRREQAAADLRRLAAEQGRRPIVVNR
jgi:cell division septation protein DedD